MKKLMTALAACLVAGFVVAQSVTSANIVGYNTTVTVAAGGQNIVGVNFEAVGGGASTFQTMNGNHQFSDGDFVYQWDGSSYGQGFSWDGGEAVWVDLALADVGDPVIDAGSAFWLICSAQQDVTIAGQVPASGTSLVVPGGTQYIIANPLPIGLDLNSANVSWTGVSDGDFIYVWNGTDYGQGFSWDGGESVWVDLEIADVSSGVKVQQGQGFWLINQNEVTLSGTY